MNRDPDERAQSDGGQVPDEFDAIVAHWQQTGDVPVWPTDGRDGVDELFGPVPVEPTGVEPAAAEPTGVEPTTAHPSTDEQRRADPTAGQPTPGHPPAGHSGQLEPGPPGAARDWVPPVDPDDEHFVPPEPPPLPRIGPPAMVGLVLLTLGLVLMTAPGWVGVPLVYGLPLGLLGMAAGLGWLVLRLWPDPPSAGRDDDDDGAVI